MDQQRVARGNLLDLEIRLVQRGEDLDTDGRGDSSIVGAQDPERANWKRSKRRRWESLLALDGLPIDLYLLHAPDPCTSRATSVRALAKILDQRLVKRVGVANVNRRQLEQALDLADIAAVQVPLNPFGNRALPSSSRTRFAVGRALWFPSVSSRFEASWFAASG